MCADFWKPLLHRMLTTKWRDCGCVSCSCTRSDGVRPSHGLLLLTGGKQERVEFTPGLERRLLNTMAQMRSLLRVEAEPGPTGSPQSAAHAGSVRHAGSYLAVLRASRFSRLDQVEAEARRWKSPTADRRCRGELSRGTSRAAIGRPNQLSWLTAGGPVESASITRSAPASVCRSIAVPLRA